MFELLPENSYSKKTVIGGIALSVVLLAAGVGEIVRGDGLEGWSNVVVGLGMLVLWTTRKREVPKNEDSKLPSNIQRS